eukprot:15019649-Alexandrium_andersonii.AAC.1
MGTRGAGRRGHPSLPSSMLAPARPQPALAASPDVLSADSPVSMCRWTLRLRISQLTMQSPERAGLQ